MASALIISAHAGHFFVSPGAGGNPWPVSMSFPPAAFLAGRKYVRSVPDASYRLEALPLKTGHEAPRLPVRLGTSPAERAGEPSVRDSAMRR